MALPTHPPIGHGSLVHAPSLGPGRVGAARGPRTASWAALWLLVFVGCLAPAALNHYPMAFGDTVNYLLAARDFRPTHERAFGYGAFLRTSGGLVSFWLPAATQAALAAYLAVRLLSLEAPAWPARWRPHLLAAFAAALLSGHLPWTTSFVMPDVFAGIMVLAVILLAEHWGRIPVWERAPTATLLAGAATVHLTHPPLLLGLALAAGAVGFLLPMAIPLPSAAPPPSARRAAALALAAAVLGWGALVGANLVTYQEATTSRGASVHFFARLQADTDASGILQPHCDAGADFAVCRHLDRLRAERPSVDRFLWGMGGPALLPELGWVPGFLAEARVLNPILLREAWRDWLAASVARAGKGLTAFGLGDGMDRVGLAVLPEALTEQGLPGISAAVLSTRQADNRLIPVMPSRLANGLAAAGLVALPGLFALGLARGRPEVWWPALMFIAVWAANAALVALGGDPHGRYGARLVWIAPLLAGVLALRSVQRETIAENA